MTPDTPPTGDTARGSLTDLGPFIGARAPLTGDDVRVAVSVDVTPAVETVHAPALLGDVELGTDRLIHVPRFRLAEPVVYVARDPKTGQVLYVGMTSDLDARRLRHESEVERGNPGSPSGSNVVPGAWGVMRADWFAVPCPAEHARWLEAALKAALLPVLDRSRRRTSLNRRHREALVAAGWTEDTAERLVDAVNAGRV